MSREIERKCVICSAELKITFTKDGKYTGGHFFFGSKIKQEYWECDSCFLNSPEKRLETSGIKICIDETTLAFRTHGAERE